MSKKPFDATTKYLIDMSPTDWLRLAGIKIEANAIVEPLDASLSTITADADRLIRVTSPRKSRVYHIELQAGHDPNFDERMHWYNTLARYDLRLPVHSVAFLLRRAADGSHVKGKIDERHGEHRLLFAYSLVRLWERSAQSILAGGLATLPLAPLAAKSESEVAEVMNVVHYRFDREATPERAEELSTATYILLGLSYEEAFIRTLTSGVRKMRESSTYQAILREGRDEGMIMGRTQGMLDSSKQNLILLGTRKFGKPTVEQRAKIETETSREQLEIWLLSLLDAPDWTTLLR